MQGPRKAIAVAVDIRAALLAAVLSAILALGAGVGLGALLENNPWFATDLAASLVLGPAVLPSSGAFDIRFMSIAVVLTLLASATGTLLLAALIHGWGVSVGGAVGGIVGWVAHSVLIYGFAALMPWLASYPQAWLTVVYVLWGIIAGATYEWLNRNGQEQGTG